MTISPQRRRLGLVGGLILVLAGCSTETITIVAEAAETGSRVFRETKDEGRLQRDHVVARRLGDLTVGPNRLTVEELQPLKAIVAAVKADGEVTPDEADRILIEMERVAALRPSR